MPFPFEVPDDLSALSADEFAAFSATVRAHAAAVAADEQADAGSLIATRDLYASVTAEDTRRTEAAAAASAARADLARFTTTTEPPAAPVETPPVTEAPAAPVAPVEQPQAVVASRSTLDTPPAVTPQRFATLVAGSDVPGAGNELTSFRDAGKLIERRLSSYSSSTKGNGKARRLGASQHFVMDGKTLNRHGGVAFNRQFPEDLRITEGSDATAVLEHAGDQSRLSGGLLDSMRRSVESGRSLTAAAGWCAPSETIYDLCMLETLDGILDLPEVQATRGGFIIPDDGGPSFASIWNGIGDDGDVILSEYDVENGVDKVCVEIPCPPFVEVRLDVAYICITGSLLQRRGYPEAVTRFSQGAMVALAHKINQSVISRIVAGSGAVTTIPAQTNNTDGASQILSAVEIAAIDMRYRHRMARSQVLEVVLPAWAIGPIRAAVARRAGVLELAVTEAQILEWFRVRNIAPRFVYDWQDAYTSTGLTGAPGAAANITALPANVDFVIYPAGTWVKAVRDVVNLDTVYDNALLTQNQYTALFAEDGFNVLQMCADSRNYRTPLNPQGVTGQNV